VGVDPTQPELRHDQSFLMLHQLEDVPRNLPKFTEIYALAVLEHLSQNELDSFASLLKELSQSDARLICSVPSPRVDKILSILRFVRLIDGMNLDEHHGVELDSVVDRLSTHGWILEKWLHFQLGLNNLLVFRYS
jgi:hypothetical protein